MENYVACSHIITFHHVVNQQHLNQYEFARRARCSRELLRQRDEKHKLFQLGLLLKCPEENEEHVLTACMCALQTLHQTCVGLFERYSSSQYDDKM